MDPLVLASLGMFAMAIVTFVATVIIPWRHRPRFSIEFDNKPPYLRKTKVSPGPDVPTPHTSNVVFACWLRLKVTNSGKSSATACIGKLAKVMDQSGKELSPYDPLQLRWSRTTADGTQLTSIDLNPGEYEYLNIVHKRSDCPDRTFLCSDKVPAGSLKWLVSGKHKLQVGIYGANVKPKSETYTLTSESSAINDLRLDKSPPSPHHLGHPSTPNESTLLMSHDEDAP